MARVSSRRRAETREHSVPVVERRRTVPYETRPGIETRNFTAFALLPSTERGIVQVHRVEVRDGQVVQLVPQWVEEEVHFAAHRVAEGTIMDFGAELQAKPWPPLSHEEHGSE